MVPVEQLSNSNFLNVYYLASEIKHEMEMNPDPSKKMAITNFIYQPKTNPILGYPYFSQTRIRTITYLKSIGAIVDYIYTDISSKIYFTPIPQDEFFVFCDKLARMYWQRFPKPSEDETNAKTLSDEQVSKLKLVLDTIAFKLEECYSEDEFDTDFPLGSITIPYGHFPSSLEPFDINGLLYKLANDFHLIMTPKSDAKEVSFDFPITLNRKSFYNFKSAVDKRYSAIIPKKQTGNLKQTDEIITKVMLVDGSKVSVESAKTDEKHRFPHKLPSGTMWENITIQFTDDDTAQVLVKGKKETVHYRDMGLEGKGGKPSVLWVFLRVLAKCSGEITITDPEANTRYKKQKQGLTEALQSYFSLDFDPFHPYATAKAYKTKFVIVPPEGGFAFEKKALSQETPEENNPFADIDDYLNETAPVIAQTGTITPDDER